MAILFEMTEDFKDALEDQGVVFEGTSKEIREIKRDTVKKYKRYKKEAKSLMKEREYSKAIGVFKKAKDVLKIVEKQAEGVSEPDFVEYLKSIYLWGLVIGYITTSNAKSDFKKWVKKEQNYIDAQIDLAKSTKNK